MKARFLRRGEVDKLAHFFSCAYGSQSALASPRFLAAYFSSESRPNDELCSSIVLDEGGGIVAHYGYIAADLWVGGRVVRHRWGVNAYTRPEARGVGLGRAVAQPIMELGGSFGVIGFSAATADFYEQSGFQLFGRERFRRWVRAFDARVFEAAALIGADVRTHVSPRRCSGTASAAIVPIDKDSELVVRHRGPSISPQLSMSRLRSRFLVHAFVDYEVWGRVDGDLVVALAAVRRERLQPSEIYASRIVDAWGAVSDLAGVVSHVVAVAAERSDAFVDFAVFGADDDTVWRDAGFDLLAGENLGLLPQLTSPVAPRANHEYVGLFSSDRETAEALRAATIADVRFTRADSDRDRLGRAADARAGSLS
jgi:hypothetical protein